MPINVNITDSDNNGVIDVQSCTMIVKDGIQYKPKFSTDGLDIPIVINTGDGTTRVMYERIPKEILKDMLREYIPEILNEIKNQ